MTDTSTSDAGGQSAFKKDWGIPFGRPGNAVDYAQCVISTVTVSLISACVCLFSEIVTLTYVLLGMHLAEPLRDRSRDRH